MCTVSHIPSKHFAEAMAYIHMYSVFKSYIGVHRNSPNYYLINLQPLETTTKKLFFAFWSSDYNLQLKKIRLNPSKTPPKIKIATDYLRWGFGQGKERSGSFC